MKDLPEEMEYKPHLNIKCIAENSLKKQRLVGSFTVKSINDYFKTTEELKDEYKKCNNKTGRILDDFILIFSTL